jgi:enoyl-CoA hydratase/carnithine racemase
MAFPIPTAAVINGYVFAAGAMMVLGHDFRVMRADRVFFLSARSGYPYTNNSWHDGLD